MLDWQNENEPEPEELLAKTAGKSVIALGCNWKCESNSGIRIGERISGIDDFVRDKSVGIL